MTSGQHAEQPPAKRRHRPGRATGLSRHPLPASGCSARVEQSALAPSTRTDGEIIPRMAFGCSGGRRGASALRRCARRWLARGDRFAALQPISMLAGRPRPARLLAHPIFSRCGSVQPSYAFVADDNNGVLGRTLSRSSMIYVFRNSYNGGSSGPDWRLPGRANANANGKEIHRHHAVDPDCRGNREDLTNDGMSSCSKTCRTNTKPFSGTVAGSKQVKVRYSPLPQQYEASD